jgi:hypothetical protein
MPKIIPKAVADDNASDTDSEDDLDYVYTLQDLGLSKVSSEDDATKDTKKEILDSKTAPVVVHHFRGEHFYPSHFNRKERKQARNLITLQQNHVVPRLSLFSNAANELAAVGWKTKAKLDDIDKLKIYIQKRDAKITKASLQVKTSIQVLKGSEQVTPCFSDTFSRAVYASRYLEFVQRYVNSYTSFKQEMEKSADIKINGRNSEKTKLKWNTLKDLGFISYPFVSTSEEAHWALEYAFSLVNYDKTTTHKPREGGVVPLSPCYQVDGHPRFPYLGIVYATMHSPEELESASDRIIDLFVDDLIDIKCSSPGGHGKGGYVRARERVFIGGIDGKNISIAVVVRLPNFFYPYRSFYADKYGMQESIYNKFKQNIAKYGATGSDKKMRNEGAFNRTIMQVMQHVINFKEQQLEDFAKNIAADKGLQTMFFGVDKDQLCDRRPTIEECVEERNNRKLKIN